MAEITDMPDIAIQLEHVCKKFGTQQALVDINHAFEKGKIHGIVGNNGSGKTVLMKCICGFILPDSGRIRVNKDMIGIGRDFPRDLGLIIETPGFLPNMTGFKNLSLLASLNRKIGDKTVADTIRRVGLDPDLKKPVSKYSLGMRQRLGIAQAIMENPSILILDEPLNGLDKHSASQIRELIKGLREDGKTLLLTSHNQFDIDMLCDTVIEMDAGELTVLR